MKFEILRGMWLDQGMAKYSNSNDNRCQHCGASFSFEQWYEEPSLMDRGNIQRVRNRIIPNCTCPYPVALTNSNLQPATRKEPTVTEKQYSTDTAKNEALKAVSTAFKQVEETLLTNNIDRNAAEERAASLLTNAANRLDRALLTAGQANVTFDDIAKAFPADETVLTNRLEAIWEAVKVDNVENVS